ncbi:hypothetical protein L7F22_041007 [Adiantum nelumboides]|nr:hypothetical protein [Adiantum nelumboides]
MYGYGSLINLLEKIGKINKALEVMTMMEAASVPPNRLTYTMLMKGYVEKHDCASAFVVFEDLLKARLKLDAITYNVLITVFCKSKASAMIDQMVLANIPPDERTYTIIMEGFVHKGEVGTAFDFFKKLKQDGLKADIFTYEALLKG